MNKENIPAATFPYAAESGAYDYDNEFFNWVKLQHDFRFSYAQEFRSEKETEELLKDFIEKYSPELYAVAWPNKKHAKTYVYSTNEFVIKFQVSENYCWTNVVACSSGVAQEVMEWLEVELPQIPRKDPGVIPLKFWTMTARGPVGRVRNIQVPRWKEIEENYPLEARELVQKVMALRTPDGAGRLLLWHGPPGTGKSHAIRALLKEWAPWCNANYVVDPEVFFGRAEYMMSVILDEDNTQPNFSEEQEKEAIYGNDRWMLLIIEDAEEFLTTKEKGDAGQNLSRLLNLADGLIGQGINLLILITTNEKIGQIHPAVARDGRCISNIEFPYFGAHEAKAWLAARDAEKVVTEQKTLAQLYSELRTIRQIKLESAKANSGIYL